MENKLILIGNGFDLAHGYRTSYSDFISSDCKAFPLFKRMVNQYSPASPNGGEHWYQFEHMIGEITAQWFQRSFAAFISGGESEYEKAAEDLEKINVIFRTIGECLFSYIASATSFNKDYTLPSLRQELSPGCPVINFNYSDVAERYGCEVYYIHGSIREGHIIFGYPSRMDPDLMDLRATVFSKDKLREMLNFRRFLTQKGISPLEPAGKALMAEMQRHVEALFSLRGEYDISEDRAPPELIQEYGTKYGFSAAPLSYGIELPQLQRLVILGHSLVSDSEIIRDILDRSDHLEEVTLFTYQGEPADELNGKIHFFDGYPVDVVCKAYF